MTRAHLTLQNEQQKRNDQLLAVTHVEGGLYIEMEDEVAMDSYNSCVCTDITLTREQALELRAFLNEIKL